jgi:hypothetical protein
MPRKEFYRPRALMTQDERDAENAKARAYLASKRRPPPPPEEVAARAEARRLKEQAYQREYHPRWLSKNAERARAKQKDWHVKNPHKTRQAALKKYGLTMEAYAELMSAQGGVCGICGGDDPGFPGSMPIDHCHATGKIRGLLCHRCNHGLGQFKDSVERLRAAIAYLERPATGLVVPSVEKLAARKKPKRAA